MCVGGVSWSKVDLDWVRERTQSYAWEWWWCELHEAVGKHREVTHQGGGVYWAKVLLNWVRER